MSEVINYNMQAMSDAHDMVSEFADEIADQLSAGEASTDLFNDYSNGDSYHHESHVDKEYSLSEAAAILEQLSEHEETDSGLWEGLAPRDAISAQAAYTYGHAVMSHWQSVIREINDSLGHLVGEERLRHCGLLWIKLYTSFRSFDPDEPELASLILTAKQLLEEGDPSGCGVLADRLDEMNDYRNVSLRRLYDAAVEAIAAEAEEMEAASEDA